MAGVEQRFGEVAANEARTASGRSSPGLTQPWERCLQRLDDPHLVAISQLKIQRQPHQPVGGRFGLRTLSRRAISPRPISDKCSADSERPSESDALFMWEISAVRASSEGSSR